MSTISGRPYRGSGHKANLYSIDNKESYKQVQIIRMKKVLDSLHAPPSRPLWYYKLSPWTKKKKNLNRESIVCHKFESRTPDPLSLQAGTYMYIISEHYFNSHQLMLCEIDKILSFRDAKFGWKGTRCVMYLTKIRKILQNIYYKIKDWHLTSVEDEPIEKSQWAWQYTN